MPGRKILVIDDEPDIVSFLTTLLRDNGYEISSARNGQEGWEKAREERPDLICLDLLMPEKTGVKLYGQIRKDPTTKHIPVVMITGFGPPEYPDIDFKRFIHHRSAVPPPGRIPGEADRPRRIAGNHRPGFGKPSPRKKPHPGSLSPLNPFPGVPVK